MYQTEKKNLIAAGIELDRQKLIALSGGNLSCRASESHVVVTPSGMSYAEIGPGDMVVVTLDGTVVEGSRRPSVDTTALLHIYARLPEVRAVIHTHQVYATAVGLVAPRLPAIATTLVNAVLGDVNVAPYASAASIDMGVLAVEHLKGRRAVILKHHGVITVGETIRQALYAAVYLEDAARMYLAARSIAEPPELSAEQVQRAVDVFKDYGQPGHR
jgi:L-ribulose-5-phosphate 4-epimerase